MDIFRIGILAEGLNYCQVGFKKKYFFLETKNNHQEKMKLEITIEAKYFNAYKELFQEIFVLKPVQLSRTGQLNPPDTFIGRISKSLTEISKTLENWNIEKSTNQD